MIRTADLLLLAGGLFVAASIFSLGTHAPAKESGHPEGLFFLGEGRSLVLSAGHFVLSTPTEVHEGTVEAIYDQLRFTSVELKTECGFEVLDGRLWLGVVGRGGSAHTFTEACDERLLPSKVFFPVSRKRPHFSWDEVSERWTFLIGKEQIVAPDTFTTRGLMGPLFGMGDTGRVEPIKLERRDRMLITGWSADTGPVGLIPAPGIGGVGDWQSPDGEEVRVQRMAEGAGPVSPTLILWAPDREGISRFTFPRVHPEHPGEFPIVISWVLTGPDTAVRYVSGGCYSPEGALKFFRRKP